MPPTILITNGTVLDPSRVFERRADVLIRDGKIATMRTYFDTADLMNQIGPVATT